MATAVSERVRERATEAPPSPAVRTRVPACADCAHAQLFAVQPRALCVRAEGDVWGRTLFAGQPACTEMTPRGSDDLSLAWCTPGIKKMRARFHTVPPRAL